MRCPRFPTSDFGAAQCISNRKAKLVLTYSRQTPRLRLLGATIASSFNRSNRSSSAFWFASAARADAPAIWLSNPLAVAFADSASEIALPRLASAWFARTFRLATSKSEIVCKWDEQRKIPPSASNSPATPRITNISNTFTYLFQRSASLYSSISPRVSNRPNSSSAISDILRLTEVADFDSEKKVPISLYNLAGALGFTLQSFCLAYLLYHRLKRRHKKTLNKQDNA